MAERKDKTEKNLEEFKAFAKIGHILAELRHLVEVPFAGHLMADTVYYQNQKMAKEGTLPNQLEERPDGTLPFRNYPAEKIPGVSMDMRTYEQCYGPHIPFYMLSGAGQAKQIRDCFPPYEKVVERIESDFAEIERWLESHAKYGTRMKEALDMAKGGFRTAKLLKLGCQKPPLPPGQNPYDTLKIAIVRLGVALGELRKLSKMFDAKAGRLINTLPDSDRPSLRNLWEEETKIVLKDNPKVPYHLIKQFGKQINPSVDSGPQGSESVLKRELAKVPLSPEEEIADAQKAILAQVELRFLLMGPLAAYCGLDLLATEPSLKTQLFKDGAPKNAARIFRKALPTYELLHEMVMERIEKAMQWLERYPGWTMDETPGVSCFATLQTVKDAIVKADAERKWADDVENGLLPQWRQRLKDSCFINLNDSANALKELLKSYADTIYEIINTLPQESQDEIRIGLIPTFIPKTKINKNIPGFVKDRWRYELDLDIK
ncbi:MAG: hypothetical protein LUC43_02225 [Burkholderiales bacterium]|nr:hypothetical protein [Burkholderiales bacterium]